MVRGRCVGMFTGVIIPQKNALERRMICFPMMMKMEPSFLPRRDLTEWQEKTPR